MTVHEFFVALREGRYTSVGSYPKFFVLDDGDVVSFQEARQSAALLGRRLRDGHRGRPVSCEVNWENPELYCDWTGERIESAYAEDSCQGELFGGAL